MTGRRLFLPKNAIGLLAALAVLLQWGVPHGWMIASAAQHGAVLVPCPSVSPELAALGQRAEAGAPGIVDHRAHMAQAVDHSAHMAQAMGHAEGHDGHGAHHASPADHDARPDHSGHDQGSSVASALCDFAALGAPVLPPSPPELVPPPYAPPLPAALAQQTVAPGRGLAAPPPPATGPPVIPT